MTAAVRPPLSPKERWTFSALLVVGLLLPFLARVPGAVLYSPAWLSGYTDAGLIWVLIVTTCHGIAVLPVLLMFQAWKSSATRWIPVLVVFGYLFWRHATLNLVDPLQVLYLISIPCGAFVLGLVTSGVVALARLTVRGSS